MISELVYLSIGIGVLIYRNWCTYLSELVYLWQIKIMIFIDKISCKSIKNKNIKNKTPSLREWKRRRERGGEYTNGNYDHHQSSRTN